jgi:mono/diheme cytochrome c family protein
MRFIGGFIKFLISALIGTALAGAIIVLIVMPRMQWNANAEPSPAERWVSRYVLFRWVSANAAAERNPIPATPENLRDGEHEYDEHCAVCHAFDGSANNRVGGDFYPPVVRLDSGLKGLADGRFYFILSNGIRLSGMPAFGTKHSSDDLWKIILWVRHLPNLTPQERAAIKARMTDEESGEAEH